MNDLVRKVLFSSYPSSGPSLPCTSESLGVKANRRKKRAKDETSVLMALDPNRDKPSKRTPMHHSLRLKVHDTLATLGSPAVSRKPSITSEGEMLLSLSSLSLNRMAKERRGNVTSSGLLESSRDYEEVTKLKNHSFRGVPSCRTNNDASICKQYCVSTDPSLKKAKRKKPSDGTEKRLNHCSLGNFPAMSQAQKKGKPVPLDGGVLAFVDKTSRSKFFLLPHRYPRGSSKTNDDSTKILLKGLGTFVEESAEKGFASKKGKAHAHLEDGGKSSEIPLINGLVDFATENTISRRRNQKAARKNLPVQCDSSKPQYLRSLKPSRKAITNIHTPTPFSQSDQRKAATTIEATVFSDQHLLGIKIPSSDPLETISPIADSSPTWTQGRGLSDPHCVEVKDTAPDKVLRDTTIWPCSIKSPGVVENGNRRNHRIERLKVADKGTRFAEEKQDTGVMNKSLEAKRLNGKSSYNGRILQAERFDIPVLSNENSNPLSNREKIASSEINSRKEIVIGEVELDFAAAPKQNESVECISLASLNADEDTRDLASLGSATENYPRAESFHQRVMASGDFTCPCDQDAFIKSSSFRSQTDFDKQQSSPKGLQSRDIKNHISSDMDENYAPLSNGSPVRIERRSARCRVQTKRLGVFATPSELQGRMRKKRMLPSRASMSVSDSNNVEKSNGCGLSFAGPKQTVPEVKRERKGAGLTIPSRVCRLSRKNGPQKHLRVPIKDIESAGFISSSSAVHKEPHLAADNVELSASPSPGTLSRQNRKTSVNHVGETFEAQLVSLRPPGRPLEGSLRNKTTMQDFNDGWDETRVCLLQRAHRSAEPTSQTFWHDIADSVGLKTAHECREKFFSLHEPPVPIRERKSKAASMDNNFEDDLFQSTPLRPHLRKAHVVDDTRCSRYANLSGMDLGSAIKFNKRCAEGTTSGEDDLIARHVDIRPKAGYKSYVQNMRRAIVRSRKDKGKRMKQTKSQALKGSRAIQETVYDHEVDMNARLTPGGTLRLRNQNDVTEADDFWEVAYGDDSDQEVDSFEG